MSYTSHNPILRENSILVLPATKVTEGETCIGFPAVVAMALTKSSFCDEVSFTLLCNLHSPVTIHGPHLDHGVYMSARHGSHDLDSILGSTVFVKLTSSFRN